MGGGAKLWEPVAPPGKEIEGCSKDIFYPKRPQFYGSGGIFNLSKKKVSTPPRFLKIRVYKGGKKIFGKMGLSFSTVSPRGRGLEKKFDQICARNELGYPVVGISLGCDFFLKTRFSHFCP